MVTWPPYCGPLSGTAVGSLRGVDVGLGVLVGRCVASGIGVSAGRIAVGASVGAASEGVVAAGVSVAAGGGEVGSSAEPQATAIAMTKAAAKSIRILGLSSRCILVSSSRGSISQRFVQTAKY